MFQATTKREDKRTQPKRQERGGKRTAKASPLLMVKIMAKSRVFDLMIDGALFGQSLSDFVKAHINKLGGYTLGEVRHLWQLAKARASRLLTF